MTNPIVYEHKERGERKVFASVADLNLWLDMQRYEAIYCPLVEREIISAWRKNHHG